MLRPLNINVANNTPVAHGMNIGRTPKKLEGTAEQLKYQGRKPKNDNGEKMWQQKGKDHPSNLNRKKKEGENEVKGPNSADGLMKAMGDRDAEMRFTYLPLKDKYEGTFVRESHLEGFIALEDDFPKTEHKHGDQIIDIIADFVNENVLM